MLPTQVAATHDSFAKASGARTKREGTVASHVDAGTEHGTAYARDTTVVPPLSSVVMSFASAIREAANAVT
jgi:hypothetical protein